MPDFESIYKIIQAGGPVAIAALLFYMWREERIEKAKIRELHEALQGKILENAMAQVQATTKMEGAIVSLKDVLNIVLQKLNSGG